MVPPTKVIDFSDLTRPSLWEKILPDRHATFFLVGDELKNSAAPSEASLVIASQENWLKLVELLENKQLSPAIPLLVLVDNGEPPELPKPYDNTCFIDYLPLPAHQQLLAKRVALLMKINKTMAVTKAQTATMDRHLTTLYSRDGLTGLFNRRHLTIHLQEIFKQAREDSLDLALLLINIDYFNSINRLHGLKFGDAILNQMAARLTEHTRRDDTCYRFSGEDFLVLMPNTNLATATELAHELYTICTNQPFGSAHQKKFITVSIGIAALQENQPADHEELICMAESALFSAKAEGRNRIRCYANQQFQSSLSPQQSIANVNETLCRILEKTRQSAISSMQLLARNVAGPEHQDHIDKTLQLFDLLGAELNLPEHHMQTFHNAAALYNSFRFLIHRDLLNKPTSLTDNDWKTIADLPFRLAEVTDMFAYFANEKEVLQNHCERFDGDGYPLGLKGDQIPFAARLFNIVNSVAAMSADRPFRSRLTPREIIEELQKEAGGQFDPQLVVQVMHLIKKHQILDISDDFINKIVQDIASAGTDNKQ
jgi:diguanylate cyclase (GGDEF)-like protein